MIGGFKKKSYCVSIRIYVKVRSKISEFYLMDGRLPHTLRNTKQIHKKSEVPLLLLIPILAYSEMTYMPYIMHVKKDISHK